MIARASSILILAGVLAVSVPELTAGQIVEGDREFRNVTPSTPSTPSTPLTPPTHSVRTHSHGHAGKHKPPPAPPPVVPLPPGDPVYTPGAGTTSTLWSAGTGWSPGAPVSGATTQLTYNGGTPYKNIINTNTDDVGAVGSAFSLNILDLSGNGDTTGGGSFITIAASGGRSLNFVSNGATTPVINLTGNNGDPMHLMTYTVSAPITLTNNTLFTGNGTATFNFSGAISGSASLTKSGTSLLTLSGANTYTGATIVNGGTLRAGVATVGTTSGAFGVNSAVTLANTAGATLDLNGFSNTIGSLTGGGAAGGNVTLGSATLTVGSDNTSPGAYAGVISGTGGLTKSGTGTLTLTGQNTYGGGTIVNAGTLLANNATASTGSGAVVVNNSGTLSGTGKITGSVTLNNSAVINAGTVGTVNTTFATGALTMKDTSILSVDMTSTTADKINVTGGISLVGGTVMLQLNIPNGTVFAAGTQFTLLNNITAGAISGTFSNAPTGTDLINGYYWTASYTGGDGNDFVLTAVPEPSTWVAGALALAAVGYTQRRRFARALERA
jgi:autotransporter-associated beta strand protein